MKVLHVLASNRYSGAENVVCQIIGMFSGEGNIEMAYCSPDGKIRESLEEKGILFVPINKLSGKELKRVIKNYRPDIIHAHDMRASFVVSRCAKKIPFISHIHNNAFDSRAISLKSIAYLLAGLKAKHIFWVSDSSFKGYKFHGFFKKKSSILYNMINGNALYQKMQEDNNTYRYDVTYLGRLTYPKNPQRLIEVLAKVIQKKPDIKVAIVGTGELEEETKNLTKELKIENNIDFLGFLSNPYKILYNSKVMLMTSRWEGTPMCALEAMALGVPIVRTPVDGLKELIEEGENGFLSNDDDLLADRIYSLLMDNDLQKRFSAKEQEKFSILNSLVDYKNALKICYEEISFI